MTEKINNLALSTRKKIGLVLGGGSAKGLAHIGVIKAFEAAGLPIDFIAGTSMGALVGGWYAATRNIQFLENIFLKVKQEDLAKIIGGPDVDSSKLFKADNLSRLLKGVLGNKAVERCDIPFSAVATDAATGQEEILSSGSLVEAIRASIAIPLIFKPVKVGDKLLMDGGITNPVPADVAREMGADFVIAVDVSSRWIKIDEDLKFIKDPHELIANAFAVIEYQVAKHILRKADIVLRPAVMTYKWLEFYRAKALIGAGYDEFERQLEDIRERAGYPDLGPQTLGDRLKKFFLIDGF
ncbi:MAG: patatin-like phospholipase family protein [Patescibacteria group bacterium]